MTNRNMFWIEASRRDARRAVDAHLSALLACTLGLAVAGQAAAGVLISDSFDEWSAQTGSFTMIDFVGLEPNTAVATQYQDLGVVFVNAKAWSSVISFPMDGFGIRELAFGPNVEILFTAPVTAIALHKAITTDAFLFYFGDDVVSGPLNLGGGFVGLTFESPIDRIVVSGSLGTISIDNLHFGAPIPAPAGVFVLGLAGLLRQGRRRSG